MSNYKSLDRERSRINALGTVFAKTNRILTGNRAITVSLKEAGQGIPNNVPAMSDGQNVTINASLIKDFSSKGSLMTLLGLNYHELCHIMFTPRTQDYYTISYWAKNQGMHMTYNILEDQRIETLFTAMYSPARHYFIQMVLEHIMADKKGWTHAHVLLHGRRYIPKSIRDEFRGKWFQPASTKEVSEIIDGYRTLDLTKERDVTIAKTLVTRLHAILRQLPPQEQNKLEEESDCNLGGAGQGAPDPEASSSASDKAKESTKEQDEKEKDGEDGSGFWADDDSEEEEADDEDGSGSGDNEEDEDDGSDSEGESGSGSASDDDESDDGDSDDGDGESGDDGDDGEDGDSDSDSDASGESDGSDGNGESESESGSSTGESDEGESDGEEDGEGGNGVGGGGFSDAELKEELEDILNAAENSETTTEDLRQLNNAMNDPHNFDLDSANADTRLVDIPEHIRNASKRVGDEFRRLYAEMEPGWKYGSDEGKLNVNRAMHSEDGEDIFDQWDEGRQESSGLELVICLDISGSMISYGYMGSRTAPEGVKGTPILAACYAVWVMKRACEELGATVSVVGFGTSASTIIPRHAKARMDKAVYVHTLEGDTRPAEAFGIARWVLSQSEQPNKLFVVVTDGVWGETGNSSRYIEKRSLNSGYGADRTSQIGSVLSEIPGTKLFLGIGQGCPAVYKKYFDVANTINNAEDIVPVVKAAITNMMKKVR